MKKLFLPLLFNLASVQSMLYAQPVSPQYKDTLPGFSVKNVGNNRLIIGWINNYPVIKQISIQRSFDSLSFFKTILTVPDPSAIQNGYMDTKAINDHMFYRLYILLDKGIYLFSAAQKPVVDSFRKKIPVIPLKDTFLLNRQPVQVKPDTIMFIEKPELVRAQPVVIKLENLQWGDSVSAPKPEYNKPKVEAFTPSLYVFTNRDGYVRIKLPESEKPKKYAIKFFEEDNTFLFELKDIREKDFRIDKTDFYHAGWFRFELYENGQLLERHKFYLEKDF